MKPQDHGAFNIDTPIKYYHSEEFDTHGDEILKYDETLDPNAYSTKKSTSGSHLRFGSLYDDLHLSLPYTKQTQLKMFKKYNYIKHLSEKLRTKLKQEPLSSISQDDFKKWLYYNELFLSVKNKLIEHNMKMLIYAVSKVLDRGYDHSIDPDSALSECVFRMYSIVDNFDYRMNFQFSTYLYTSIFNHIYRSFRAQQKTDDKQREMAADLYNRKDPDDFVDHIVQNSQHDVIKQCINRLDPRSQQIIRHRFGIGVPYMTLKDLGIKFGLTKERVRQIEIKSINKIRLDLSLIDKEFKAQLEHLI